MAQRATSLGPKPSLFIFVVFVVLFFFGFVFWLLNTEKNLVFPPEQGIFCLFSVFLFLSPLALFWASLFFCFSFSVSLFSSFLSFFLLVFVFAFLWFLVFVPFLFLSLSSLLFFHERNNIKILNCKFFFLKSFLFFWFSVFFSFKFLFLIFALSWFYVMFSVQHKGFWFQNKELKKKHFLVKRGVATKRGFLSTCVLQNVKSYRFFWGHFFGNFWLMFKKHYKNRYFSTFLKAKKWKQWPFLIVTNWATLIVTNWATFVQLKNGQRGPVSNY